MPYNNGQTYNNTNSRFGGGRSGGYPRQGGQGGGRRNSGNDNASNTTGFTLANERAGKFLNFSYWNKCLTLEIGTYPAGTPFSFDVAKNANKLSQAISFSGIHELHCVCEDILTAMKETNAFTSTAVTVGSNKDCLVEISNGRNINMPAGIYLVIYKNLDSGKRTNIMEFYPFTSTKVLLDYDHNTGAGREDIRANGDFKKFCFGVKEAAKAFTMAAAHAVIEAKKYDKMATFMALSAIGAALGVDMNKQLQEKRSSGQASYGGGGYPRQGGQGGGWASGRFNGNPNAGGGYQQKPALEAVNNDPVDITLDASTLSSVDMTTFN